VRVPASLEDYYLPPDQRLYKSNQGWGPEDGSVSRCCSRPVCR